MVTLCCLTYTQCNDSQSSVLWHRPPPDSHWSTGSLSDSWREGGREGEREKEREREDPHQHTHVTKEQWPFVGLLGSKVFDKAVSHTLTSIWQLPPQHQLQCWSELSAPLRDVCIQYSTSTHVHNNAYTWHCIHWFVNLLVHVHVY